MELGVEQSQPSPREATSTDLRLAAANLSKADVAEIKKFAKGKSRMEEHTHHLLHRPLVDAFADFHRVDIEGEPDPSQLQTAWQNLDKDLADVQRWQDECDAIELEVTQLEVDDMMQLRRLTKAAIQREMSPEDTDLAEIAIHTLAALDALQRNLSTRQRDLDVLGARLHWEVERRKCWQSYVVLTRDFKAFSTLSGRWNGSHSSPAKKAQGYDRGVEGSIKSGLEEGGCAVAPLSEYKQNLAANSSVMSSNGNGNIVTQHVAFLQGEVEQLARRSHAFIAEGVKVAEVRLDRIIELCKVPEAFLDEQDRLDDLSEAVKKRLIVVAHLSRQWRWAEKSDALSKLLSILKIDANAKAPSKDDKRDLQLVPVAVSDVSTETKSSEAVKPSAEEAISHASMSEEVDCEDNHTKTIADARSADERQTASDTEVARPVSVGDEQKSDVEATEELHATAISHDKATSPSDHVGESQRDDLSFSSEDLGSSLPSLSSTESVNDVFVVPATPTLKRTTSSSPDQKTSCEVRSVTKRTHGKVLSPDTKLSSASTATPARRVVSDSAVLRQVNHTTPSRREKHALHLRSTPSRLPVALTPRAGATPTPTNFATHQQRSSATPVSRVASQRVTSVTPVESLASRSKSSLSGIRERTLSTQSTGQQPSSAAKRGPNRYKANPRSKLDVMVGQIVNQLGIPVSITHAAAVSPPPTTSGGTRSSSSSGRESAASSTRSRDERENRRPREQWNDESGRYWVGHPDPKLCFCRVLRSKTVMVRVGGGWEELSSYIVKHFSHLAPGETLSAAASPQNSPRLRKTSTAFDALPWLSSSSLLSTPKHSMEDVFGVMPSTGSQTSITSSDSRGSIGRAARSHTTGTPTGKGGDSRSSLYTSPAASISSTYFGFPPSSDSTDGRSPEAMSAFWLRKESVAQQQRSASSSAHQQELASPTRKKTSAWPDSKQANLAAIGHPAVRRVSDKRERLRALSSVK